MSSQTTTAPGRDISEPPGPSPLPSDDPPGEIGNEGHIGDLQPPSDVPNVEEMQPPTFLDNPLAADRRLPGEPEPEETKEDSDERDTTPIFSPAPAYVTECATLYSILMACISNGNTALHAYYARTGEEKALRFWMWIILPISTTAMALSFVLKPRRKVRAYKVFLILQYVLYSFVSEILSVVGEDFTSSQIIISSVRSLLWLALLEFGLKTRSHVAKLSDEDLSKFLITDVIFGGMLVGLPQLAFLMFASIQCNGNADDWRQCSRTLISQAGLSFIVTLFTIIKLASGVVPKRILNKHAISMKKVFAMDLNAEQAVHFFGLAIAAGCALYPLGNYGAEGDFRSDVERFAAYTVPSIGGGCLLLTAVWKLVVIRGEIRREVEEAGQQYLGEPSSGCTLLEASSFWLYIGFLATTFQSSISVAMAVTMNKSYGTLCKVSLPIVGLMYVGSVFCQPRRRSPKDMWKLRLHFMSSAFIGEMAWAVYGFRKGNFSGVILHFVRLVSQALVFHFGLKLRAAVGRLPDKDLETFLVNTLFKGGSKTLFSVLFLTFRTTKCMFEEGSVAECDNTSWCSMFISIYLIAWWLTKLVQGSVRSEWRKDLNLSMENIARMSDISLRRGLSGFLTLVAGVCAIFLFSMMSADDMDKTTITVVGFTGLVASLGAVISEMYSILKAQKRRIELSESGHIVELATDLEEPVKECSWFFVGVSFLFTSVYSGLNVCFGATLEDKYRFMATLILPLVALSLAMAVLYKPKRSDAGYMRFLYFHFFTFAVVSAVAVTVGCFRRGLVLLRWFAIFSIPIFCLAFWLGLKLRESAAKLPPQELSDFLCQTVLVKGTSAMGTMLFFSFEVVSCLISRDSFDRQCTNTSTAALILSLYLAVLTALSIVSKTVPKSVQRETVWELSSIATLKGLKWWQGIQGGLMTITAIVSLFLLSVLGVEGNENSMLWLVGAMGGGGIGFAALISLIMLVRTRNEEPQNTNTTTVESPKQRSARRFSAGDIEENAIALALV
ncbi:hypothetical protein TrLO_g10204 [Triparma laevis f. longispina]|uniref:Transmembrane protein n=1 Tax=Triparma laevis f. longispina TaxID=1714387 RepID=A0A9W7C961_9STRA|nr:hypothetical protein TrLO_g10204 [Triparma laevis f. longispina]